MPRLRLILSVVGVFILALVCMTVVASIAPRNFPTGGSFVVEKGATLSTVAQTLTSRGIIKSPVLFKAYTVLVSQSANSIKVGEYLLSEPQSSLRLAHRLTGGLEGYPVVKVTIPEGNDYRSTAQLISRSIPSFDTKSFMPLAKANEGYLFPETYFWPLNLTPERAVKDMRETFDRVTSSLKTESATATRSFRDIVIMASLLEREATTTTDRKIIAGILWKRLDMGMALQVDASFYYVLGISNKALTLDDLQMKSPYNLYTNVGLPPTAIANPGLEAIRDAIYPTKTKYLYYLTGRDGRMHYAATFDEHIVNKAKYIK